MSNAISISFTISTSNARLILTLLRQIARGEKINGVTAPIELARKLDFIRWDMNESRYQLTEGGAMALVMADSDHHFCLRHKK